MKPILFVIIGLLIASCELQGVDGTDTSDDSVIPADSALETENNPEIIPLLADSVNGTPNDMVYNGSNGLRIEWTKKNTGDPILLNDAVMINYKARVAAGEEYDSNKSLGEPVPVKTNIGMLIKGWEEGLLHMNIGDKGRIMIPNALAYGDDGYLDKVPPQADIIVDIEIISRIEPIALEEGVKVYKWKTEKTGDTPVKNQLITFDYFAFTTGTKAHLYDNSYQNGVPFSFKFENAGVVDGLHQGMSIMKPGENAYIEIPAELAYGKAGLKDLVPAYTDIVYDVRVISIE